MKYYLGLDNGGTVTKAALFDEIGREIAVASTATEAIIPAQGHIERDMEKMWEANKKVIREIIEKSGVSKEQIACVACCGHGKGLYLWGHDDKPVRNGIISTDSRAWRYPLKWEEEGITEKVFSLSCQHILPSQPVALLAWLRDNEDSVIERTKYIFACKDYIRFRLTNVAMAEKSDYSGNNVMNLHTGKYDRELLSLFGLDNCMDKLPPLCNATDICGYITEEAAAETGLLAGTPVAGGAFDINACAIAVDVVDDNNMCVIAGTWSINECLRKEPIVDGSVLMNSIFCIPEYFLIEESSPTSAGNLEWIIQNLLPEVEKEKQTSGENIYGYLNDMVGEIETAELCPFYLPFLMGSNAQPDAKAAFVGLGSHHSRAHLIRAVYEGVAFSHRWHIEKIMNSLDKKPEKIRLAGGATKSAIWVSIFADVLGMPIECVEVNETGAAGCAIIAAVASGKYKDIYEATGKMCRIQDVVYPDKSREKIMKEKYQIYCSLVGSLGTVWNKMTEYNTDRNSVADRNKK